MIYQSRQSQHRPPHHHHYCRPKTYTLPNKMISPSDPQSFLNKVNRQFLDTVTPQHLLKLSSSLHKFCVSAASTSPAQMLPSHITTLPSGQERGQYLAVD